MSSEEVEHGLALDHQAPIEPDYSDADLSAWLVALRIFRNVVSSATGVALSSIAVTLVLGIVIFDFARSSISGWLFALTSVVAFFLLAGLAEVAFPGVTRALLQVSLGPKLEGSGRLQREEQSIVRIARNIRFKFSDERMHLVDFYKGLDQRLLSRQREISPDETEAILQIADPKDGLTVGDLIEDRSLEYGATRIHVGQTAVVAIRLTAISMGVIAIAAVLEADGRMGRVLLSQISIGLVFFSTLIVVILLSVDLSAVHFMMTDEILHGLTEDERDLAEETGTTIFYPEVTFAPQFHSAIRRYMLLLHIPIVVANLIALAFLFGGAALLVYIWPASVDDWTGNLATAFTTFAWLSALYLVGFIVLMTIFERFRDALEPVVMAVVAGVVVVLITYLVGQDVSLNASLGNVTASLPTAIASGVGAAFWRKGTSTKANGDADTDADE